MEKVTFKLQKAFTGKLGRFEFVDGKVTLWLKEEDVERVSLHIFRNYEAVLYAGDIQKSEAGASGGTLPSRVEPKAVKAGSKKTSRKPVRSRKTTTAPISNRARSKASINDSTNR